MHLRGREFFWYLEGRKDGRKESEVKESEMKESEGKEGRKEVK